MGEDSLRRVTVACSHHHDALVNGLWNFLSSKNGVDFDLRWRGRSIRAHHLILQVFLPPEKLDQSAVIDTATDQDQRLVTEENGGAGVENLDSLLEFLYNGKVTVLEEQLEGLLQIATELDFKLLVDSIASSRMASEQPPENDTCTEVGGRTRRKSIPRRLVRETPTSNSGSDEEWSRPIRKRACTTAKKSEIGGRPPKRGKLNAVVAKHSPSDDSESTELLEGGEVTDNLALSDEIAASQPRKAATGKSTIGVRRRALPAKVVPSKMTTNGKLGVTGESSKVRVKLVRKRNSQGRQVFPCEFCSLVFRCRTSRQIHTSRHDPSVLVFRCHKCSKAYLTAEQLDKHRPAHADEPDTYECDQCDYKNPRKYLLKAHQISRHGTRGTGAEADNVKAESVEVYKCKFCYHKFYCKDKLETHEANHKPIRCSYCDHETLKPNSMNSHLASRHGVTIKGEAVPMLQCEKCDYKCKRPSYMKFHVAAKHSGHRPHKCPQCSFRSVRKTDVGRHINVVHLNMRPHLCELCGYRTVSQSQLDKHVRTHTGEKIYKCETCNKSYGNHSSLRQHNQILHGIGSALQTFICQMCGNIFNRRHRLKRHLKNVHEIVSGLDELMGSKY